MSKFTDAADAIKRQLKTMEQWAFAAQALEEIGSLDNATKEAQSALAAAQKERDAAKVEATKAKDAAKDAKLKVEAMLLTAEKDAEEIVRAAQEKANAVEATAKSKAEEALALAKTNSEALYAAARLKADNIGVDLAKKQQTLDAINDQIKDAEDRLAKATKQLDAIKGKLSALVD
jgi:uncharacterized coiled-coil protein SlyX